MAEVSTRDLGENAGSRRHGPAAADPATPEGAIHSPSVAAMGLAPEVLERLDWQTALQRVLHDIRSDFIWAPHLRFIYSHAGEELIDEVKAALAADRFHTRPVLSIEVPKSARIKVTGSSKRLGPAFTRPGSIPMPRDRLLYQVLADDLSLPIERATDRSRCFSHRLAEPDAGTMFISNRKCWSELQAANRAYARDHDTKYVLRLDISNYFGSINLKILAAALADIDRDGHSSHALGRLLIDLAGGHAAGGLIQGVYPSDLLGTFYMNPVDQLFDDLDIRSARYVDDLYIFTGSVDEADAVLRRVIPFFRSYELTLNETKSAVLPKIALFSVEPDLEALFNEAVTEISEQLDEVSSATEYGFQKDWQDRDDDDGEDAPIDIELQATKALFASIGDFPGAEETIERFCLPLFAKAGSDIAINHVLDALSRRPSMTQIYSNYLAKFIDGHDGIEVGLLKAIDDVNFYDWQKMWLLACLMQTDHTNQTCVKVAAGILSDPLRHDALRAVAALVIGKFGDASRRRALAIAYGSMSEYVQLAIYFASRDWPPEERAAATHTWSGHGPLHRLMERGLASL